MSFTFEIDNFSKKKGVELSPNFFSGGCEWYVEVFPKGYIVDDHLSLYLFVANPESLSLGWERRASFSFALLNESGKELFKTKESSYQLFCAEFSGWGTAKTVPLKKLQEKGFLEKNKLRVKVKVKVVEVVDEGDVTGKETLDIRGFQVLYPQVVSVGRLFIEHPKIAKKFRLKNQLVKTAYMNLLLGLIQTMDKPPHSFSEDELSNACIELMELTEAGFKVDWLKTKLDEVSLERKKENTLVQELEEHIKNLTLELNEEKVKTATSATKGLSLEHTLWDLKDELSELEDKVRDLNIDLNKEMSKTDTSAAKVMSLEQTVSDLKVELKREKIKSATWVNKVSDLNVELKREKIKSATCGAKVLSLDQMVSNLQDELNKEKHVSGTSAAKVLSLEQKVSELEKEVSFLEDELNMQKHESDKVLSLEQTVSDLEDELNKEKHVSDTSAAKVLLLEQTVSDLKDEVSELEDEVSDLNDELNKEKQTVLSLRAELKKEKAATCSWEVLDYDDN